MALSHAASNPPGISRRLLRSGLLILAAVFFALHFVHLTADFPNFSPWMDWSKYTDEGWYGDAAIRHYLLGHWYVAGDFNPAAALPVWPILEGLLFHFTGVSLIAARALTVVLFGLTLLSAFLLLRRWSSQPRRAIAPAAAVCLLAVSPFCFAFTRLAILEPLMVLLTLVLLLAAGRLRPPAPGAPLLAQLRLNLWPIIALGLLLPTLILTKTTGVFLIPSVAFLALAALDFRWRAWLTASLSAATLAALLWLIWFFAVIRPHYLPDYRYLFLANSYSGITRANAVQVLTDTFQDGRWMGLALYAAALAALLFTLGSLKRLRSHPLPPALLLWALGYEGFLAYHDNLQPRYYLLVAVPLTLLVPAVVEDLVLPRIRSIPLRRAASLSAVLGLIFLILPSAILTAHFVERPQYTLIHAARQVQDVILREHAADPTHSTLLLSISGSDISLITGLPSICDDFGTLDLVDRVDRYRPGWYAAWNEVDDDKMEALAPFYRLARVAAFPAMDDPERNLLILYRLDRAVPSNPPAHPRKHLPAHLRTRIGEQAGPLSSNPEAEP